MHCVAEISYLNKHSISFVSYFLESLVFGLPTVQHAGEEMERRGMELLLVYIC